MSIRKTVRCRFVALDLAERWIDLRRKGGWTLKHPDRKGGLTVSMFPVAQGIRMDLATVQALSREKQRNSAFARPFILLDEVCWSNPAVFCLATSSRTRTPHRSRPAAIPWPGSDHPTYLRSWTVSDGAYVLEATLHEYDEDAFHVGAKDCDTIMRSVRFEGPR